MALTKGKVKKWEYTLCLTLGGYDDSAGTSNCQIEVDWIKEEPNEG